MAEIVCVFSRFSLVKCKNKTLLLLWSYESCSSTMLQARAWASHTGLPQGLEGLHLSRQTDSNMLDKIPLKGAGGMRDCNSADRAHYTFPSSDLSTQTMPWPVHWSTRLPRWWFECFSRDASILHLLSTHLAFQSLNFPIFIHLCLPQSKSSVEPRFSLLLTPSLSGCSKT